MLLSMETRHETTNTPERHAHENNHQIVVHALEGPTPEEQNRQRTKARKEKTNATKFYRICSFYTGNINRAWYRGSIPDCHSGDPGSIPGARGFVLIFFLFFLGILYETVSGPSGSITLKDTGYFDRFNTSRMILIREM